MNVYNVSEIFWSAQGEGARAGIPSIFIRMMGCSLKCEYCDTKYSWKNGAEYSSEKILSEVKLLMKKFPGTRQIVITGGEPLEQEISNLIELLRKNGYFVSIETNGVNNIYTEVDWLTVSPKDVSSYKINKNLIEIIDEIKLIVNENLNIEKLKTIRNIEDNFPIFLQPQSYDKNRFRNTYNFYKYCVSKGIVNLRLGFQLHKFYKID